MTPARRIQQLYGKEHGYQISAAEEARVTQTGASATYGEIRPGALTKLVRALELTGDDVLYDLGSGVGKTILQTALMVPGARHIGIELVRSRHNVAQRILARARRDGLLRGTDVRFRFGDITKARLADATVLYTCSTAFPSAFMNELAAKLSRLPIGVRLVSLQDLDPNPYFIAERSLRLDVSWRRGATVHIYRLQTSRRAAVPYPLT